MAHFQNHMNALENFSSSAWYLILKSPFALFAYFEIQTT